MPRTVNKVVNELVRRYESTRANVTKRTADKAAYAAGRYCLSAVGTRRLAPSEGFD